MYFKRPSKIPKITTKFLKIKMNGEKNAISFSFLNKKMRKLILKNMVNVKSDMKNNNKENVIENFKKSRKKDIRKIKPERKSCRNIDFDV